MTLGNNDDNEPSSPWVWVGNGLWRATIATALTVPAFFAAFHLLAPLCIALVVVFAIFIPLATMIRVKFPFSFAYAFPDRSSKGLSGAALFIAFGATVCLMIGVWTTYTWGQQAYYPIITTSIENLANYSHEHRFNFTDGDVLSQFYGSYFYTSGRGCVKYFAAPLVANSSTWTNSQPVAVWAIESTGCASHWPSSWNSPIRQGVSSSSTTSAAASAIYDSCAKYNITKAKTTIGIEWVDLKQYYLVQKRFSIVLFCVGLAVVWMQNVFVPVVLIVLFGCCGPSGYTRIS